MARETKSKREPARGPRAELNSWLEERLINSAWNEALSAISMGLAHDTNNCLTGILSMSDACLVQLGSQDPMRENLNLVKESAQKAAQIIQQLMGVHHEKAGRRAHEDLNRVTSETAELLKRVLRRQIELHLQLETVPLPIYIDAVELRRIIILLALNAAQAMPTKGRIGFRTFLHQEIVVLRHFYGILPRPPTVCLRVTHNGQTSVSQESLLFDPGTDAQQGRSDSAWRLRAAQQFVAKHRGALSVETQKASGTTIELWLPQADFTEGENE